jgi:hypothetical protein
MKERLRSILESVFGPDRPAPRWLRYVACALLAYGLFWFVSKALVHGQVNNAIANENDQLVYVHYAQTMADYRGRDATAVKHDEKLGVPEPYTPRMRMPLYPWLLSLMARPHMRSDDLFGLAQAFNIFLSAASLVVMYVLLRRWLGPWMGLCFVLVAAFQLYVQRAAYVQPELLLTTIVTVTWAWLVHTLRNPNWKNGLVAGVLLCCWFLTKASAQAALLLFLAVMGAKWLFAGRGKRMPYVITAVVTVVFYVLPMSPYLYTSWVHFHDPFYNAQSKYYLWCEPSGDKEDRYKRDKDGKFTDDKHVLQRLNLDMNLDNLPKDPSALPSRQSYMKHHEGHLFEDVKNRILGGNHMMFKLAFNDFSSFYFMTAVFMGAAVWGAWLAWPQSFAALWEWKWEILYVVGLACAFMAVFGWFAKIQVGPRIIESVSLAITFFAAAAAHRFLKNQTATVGGMRVSLEKVFAVLFLLLWAGVTVYQTPKDLLMGYFGG